MKTLAVSKSPVFFNLLAIASLILLPSILLAQSKIKVKSVKVNQAFVVEQNGRSITCALVGNKWLSGTLKSGNKFTSDNAKFKATKAALASAREPERSKLSKKLKRIKKTRKSGKTACENGPPQQNPAPDPTPPAIDPLRKLDRPMTKGDIQHLYRRAALGFVPEVQMNLGLNYGVAALINNLVTKRNDGFSEQYARSLLPDANGNTTSNGVKYYALYKLMLTKNPLQNHLCMIHLHDILSVSILAVNNNGAYRDLMLRYFDTLCRLPDHGSYRNLIKEITIDPAMLIWLDGNKNNKLLPNENYGRELLELFTLGVRNRLGQATYTDLDIARAAQALTGFGVINSAEFGLSTIFNYSAFDDSPKTIFKNTSAEGSAYDWEELIDRIFDHHPNIAYNLALMLAERYVRPDIATANPALVLAMAADLKANDFNLMATLTRLLMSEEFYKASNRHSILRSPVEASIHLFRAFYTTGVPLNINPFTPANILAITVSGGHILGEPPSVFGVDRDEEFTVGSRYIQMSNKFTTIAGSSQLNSMSNPTGWSWVDLYPPGLANPSAGQVVDHICNLLSISINTTKRNILLDYLNTQYKQVTVNGQPQIEIAPDPWNPGSYSQARRKVSGLLRILLHSSEFRVY